MMMFDFLFYYLTMWFSTAKTKQFRSPPEQTSYVLGISLLLLVMNIYYLLGYFLYNSTKAYIPVWLCMLIGLDIIQFFQYLYIEKGRYEFVKVREQNNSQFNVSDKNGIALSIAFGVSGLFLMIFSAFLIHFLNGDL
jgi:hypothetical protein